jgi:hypothetical protein
MGHHLVEKGENSSPAHDGSIPLLYLHYQNDLWGKHQWLTGKSEAHYWQAAPEIKENHTYKTTNRKNNTVLFKG